MPEADPYNIDAIERLAAVCAQQGKLHEAATLLRQVLDKKPDSLRPHFDLANLLYALGRMEEAKAHYEAAILLKPDYADAHYNLGVVLQALGQPTVAMMHYERALALKEDYARAHSNLGNILHAFGRFAEATTHYERALLTEPESAEVLSNLGSALNELGRHQEAMARLEQALARKPNLAEAHSNLALVLQRIGDHEQAIIRYKAALDLKPNSPEVHNNLGHSLQALDRWEEAIAQFQRALALKADYAEAHVNLGRAQKACGRIAEARQRFETAIALSPKRGSFYLHLTECKTFGPEDPHLHEMEKLATEDSSLSLDERVNLHFALGSALADVARHDLSFEHFRAGNALKRQQIVYDEVRIMARIDRIRTVFTPELMRARAGLGDSSTVPVFIVGMPRSGSTLVEQILAGHPDVFGAGELDHFAQVVQSMRRADGPPFDYPEGVPELPGAMLRGIGSRYQERLSRHAPAALCISDKMPSNWFFAGLIHLALPNARIIHTRRDPVDTCLSCFSTLFHVGHDWSYELGELGRHYRAYATTMAHWRAVLPPGTMLEVRYEDVVGDLERQARRILDYCGLAWDGACLNFHRAQRPVKTASAAQVRRPLYQSSVGRWRVHAERLRPLLEALGPDLQLDGTVNKSPSSADLQAC